MNESRNWIWPIVIGITVCSVVIVFVSTGVAHLEYHYAKWTHAAHHLPLIAETFKTNYLVGWLLPTLCAFVGALVLTKKLTNVMVIACWASALAVAHVTWIMFTLLALYLTNQSFVAG